MTTASALTRLLKPVTPLAADMSIADVADRLLTPEHKAFLSLPIVDAAGRPLGLVSRSTLQDIFMQRFGRDLRGRHAVQSEKMASLGQMVAGVAHELNTPLGYVKTTCSCCVNSVRRCLSWLRRKPRWPTA